MRAARRNRAAEGGTAVGAMRTRRCGGRRACLRILPSLLVALASVACGMGAPAPDLAGITGVDEAGTLFLTRSAPAPDVMEALFRGRVVRDAEGCIRLDSPEPATVVWPFGFELRGGRTVVDDRGRTVGDLGGRFVFGGGHVGGLHDGIGLPAALAAEARARCPGDYWIVGEVPGH